MFSSASAIIEQFDCDNSTNLGPRWNQWLQRLEQLFVVTKTVESVERVATLFLLGGVRLHEIHATLPTLVTNSSADTDYKKAVFRLNSNLNPKLNSVIDVFRF